MLPVAEHVPEAAAEAEYRRLCRLAWHAPTEEERLGAVEALLDLLE